MEQLSTSGQRRYLTIPETSQEYGGSHGFWRRRVLLREIDYYKFGKAVRLCREDIEAFLRKRRVAARNGSGEAA